MTDKPLSSLTQGTLDTGGFIYGVVGSNSRKVQLGTLPFADEDADLADIVALTPSSNRFIVGDTGSWISDTGSAVRNRLALDTGDNPQFAGINLGHASDTTLVRDTGGDIAVEGNRVYRAGGTDVPITDGGTGESTASAAFTALKQAATTSATGVVEEATDAEVRAATDGKFLDAGHLQTANALVTLTDATTVAIDWTSGINFTLTITTDRILGNPTNEIPGTFRTVFVISDGGPDELTFGSEYGGTPPTLDDITTTQGYLLSIYCRAAGQFLVSSIDGSPA